MMYKCKILTDDYLAKVDAYINEVVKDEKDSNKRDEKARKLRRSIYYMWNNPSAFIDHPTVKSHYESLGLFTPQYTEMVFSAGKGFHIEPRITWLHQPRKINDIKEIFSYEQLKD